MQIHQLQPRFTHKRNKRVGRGGKRGTYSGKGMKGQTSRSGSGGKNIVEKGRNSWIKRLPKLGGFSSVYAQNIVVKTSLLEKHFAAGSVIDIPSLAKVAKRIKPVRGKAGKMQMVKVLLDTPVTKAFTMKGVLVSKTAQAAIEKAGGSVTETPKNKLKQTKKPFIPKQ